MYRRSMIFFCAMILVLCSTMAAQSAEREMAFKKGSFYLTPTAGAFINLGSEVVPITNPGSGDPDKFGVGAIMGGRVGYFLTEHFSLEASFEYTWLDAQTTTYNLPFYTTNNHQNVWLGMVNVLYYFEPIFCDNLSPFLLAGVGVDSFAPGISGGSYDVGFAGQYGAGLEYSLTDLLSLRWEVRNLLTTNPQSNNLITTVGVGLHFGGESDAPPPPPPPPPLDSDGDGVPDDRDECPGTAPGQEVDETGCPYLDESGVIYEMPLDGAVQRGIVFDFNKATIRESALPTLNDVAETLKAFPDAKIEIAGYTDIIGNDAYNMKLSQRRAEAVQDYLISQGVPADQVTAKGYGEAHPIASNATEEGRALNRRIEFHLLTPVNHDEVREGSVLYKLSHGGIVVSGVIFQINSATIKKDSYDALTAMARTLRAFPSVKVEVAGYTDSTGPEAYNQTLSLKRAESTEKFLIERGVKPEQLTAVGYGEADPIAPNDTKEGQAMNRRIQFKTLSD